MGFLYPAFLLGALAVAVPIVLHLLRRDVAPEVLFSSVRLLRRSPIERSKRRRLRDLLLLAARVAALVLLAAAFARPYVGGASGSGVRIVAIDRSFSMGAPGRFASALERAASAIDAAESSEPVAVIAFDERADVVARPGGKSDARAALASLRPGPGGTRYGPAIDRAIEIAAGRSARLIVVTDLQRTGWEDEPAARVPEGWHVHVEDVGETLRNVAVSNVRVERDRLVATIRNGGSEPASGEVRVESSGRQVAAAPYAVPPAAAADVPIAWRPSRSGGVSVSINDPDGFAADNVRYAILDPAPRARVLIVTSSSRAGFYLERALETAELEPGAFEPRIGSGATIGTLPAEELQAHAAVVLLSTRELDRRAREALARFVRDGGGLLVAASAEIEPSVLSTTFGWQPSLAPAVQSDRVVTLAATDLRHPIFEPFGGLAANLGQVRFERIWNVPADHWQVAARFSGGTAALLERAEGRGRILLFASDVDRRWNDFPLHPSFVPFAVESVRYLSGRTTRAQAFTVADTPPGIEPVPGIHVMKEENRPVAVNVDGRESGVERLTKQEFDEMVQRTAPGFQPAEDLQARETEARQSYWRYGLLLMLAALVAESIVGRR